MGERGIGNHRGINCEWNDEGYYVASGSSSGSRYNCGPNLNRQSNNTSRPPFVYPAVYAVSRNPMPIGFVNNGCPVYQAGPFVRFGNSIGTFGVDPNIFFY